MMTFYHFFSIYQLEYFYKEKHPLTNSVVILKYNMPYERQDKYIILFCFLVFKMS